MLSRLKLIVINAVVCGCTHQKNLDPPSCIQKNNTTLENLRGFNFIQKINYFKRPEIRRLLDILRSHRHTKRK
jgi:hypothetical protein